MPYTAVKSKGTPINERILAADKYIAVGHLSPLNSMIPKARQAELKKRFDKVMSLKQYDINNVQAGRQYVKAYVQFFHFAEGEEEHNAAHKGKNKH